MVIRFATTLCSLLLVGQAALAQTPDKYKPKPIPTGPECLTNDRLVASRLAFWREAFAKEVGPVDQRCKPHVEKVLDWCAALLTYHWQDSRRTDPASHIERLAELRCDDPVVLMGSAWWFQNQRQGERARSIEQDLRKQLTARKTGALTRYYHQLLRRFLASESERRRNDDEMNVLAQEVLTSGVFGAGSERHQLEWLKRHLSDIEVPLELSFVEGLERAVGKPSYALMLLRCEAHLELGWEARGEGTAASVAENDFDIFHRELQKAGELALKAHALHPTYPEAPTLMIKAIGPAGGQDEVLRRWFDVAVAAQMDHEEAYTYYMHYNQPRWGGARRTLAQFGEECVATGRFDTDVPMLYVSALRYLSMDVDDPTLVWSRPAAKKNLDLLYEKYSPSIPADEKDWWLSNRVVALAVSRRAEQAAELFQQLGGEVHPAAPERYGVDLDWVRAQVRPHLKNYTPPTIAAADVFAGWDEIERLWPVAKTIAAAKGTTMQAFRVAYADWVKTTCLAAYEKHGIHDPTWDADVRLLLTTFAESLRPFSGPTSAADVASRLHEAKCKDPLARYMMLRAAGVSRSRSTLSELATVCRELRGRYSPVFTVWSLQYLRSARGGPRSEAGGELAPQIADAIVAAAADPAFAGTQRHFYLTLLSLDGKALIEPGWALDDEHVEALARVEGVDPWIVDTVTGLSGLRALMYGKGSSEQRAALLRTTVAHFSAAEQAQASPPFGAVGLLACAAFAGDKEKLRQWFDAIVERNVDFPVAYRLMMDFSSPRVGRSVAQLYGFGVECLDSQRFDSLVPMVLFDVVEEVIHRTEVESRSLLAEEGVGQNMKRMFEGYLSNPASPFHADNLRAGQIVVDWAGGRYEAAAASWPVSEAVARHIPEWLRRLGLDDPELMKFDLDSVVARRTKPK